MGSKPQCSETVWGDLGHHHQCFRAGVVQRDGTWYCAQHDPEKVKARRAASDARIMKEIRRDDLKWAVKAAERAVVVWAMSTHPDASPCAALMKAEQALVDYSSGDSRDGT